MPLTVFDCKGILPRGRALEAAAGAGGNQVPGPYEGWTSADASRGEKHTFIPGPQGFEETVPFAFAENLAVIAKMLKKTSEK